MKQQSNGGKYLLPNVAMQHIHQELLSTCVMFNIVWSLSIASRPPREQGGRPQGCG